MSIQVTTGAGSLLALGLGIADVITSINLARRKGNWWLASSGDADFLNLLEQDKMTLLRRRGLVNMARFKKRWGWRLRNLVNNQTQAIDDPEAEEALGELSRWTAYMTRIVAVLDEFASEKTPDSQLGYYLSCCCERLSDEKIS